MAAAPPKVPPARKTGYDPNKSYFPMKLAGLALTSLQLMQYSDALKDAKVALLSSEDLCDHVKRDFQSEQAQDTVVQAARFVKATHRELREKDAARDEDMARLVGLQQQRSGRPGTTSSQSSSSIYSATNNNPYTLGVKANNPYVLHNSSASSPDQGSYYQAPQQYQHYHGAGF